MATNKKLYAHIDYEDDYVQPLIVAALKARLPPDLLVFINDSSTPTPPDGKLFQWRQYEKLDFEHLLQHPATHLTNSYVIRKALIRKHYLSATVAHWVTKHPDSALQHHVKPSVEFEVDYAEFLDDALVEAWELKESWARNEGKEAREREWWILKPGMSERGQGIRLFSSEEELTAIFEEWDPPSDDEDEDGDDEDEAQHSGGEDAATATSFASNGLSKPDEGGHHGLLTSQLRHFVAQPYIHPPLLLPAPHPAADRKFHLRTYVLAVGALKLYVYKPMLALFASEPYMAPGSSFPLSTAPLHPNDALASHLTNTCLQLPSARTTSIHAFWDLPTHLASLPSSWRETVFDQICSTTSITFEAAARSSTIHFQPLPNAFELFGLDFLVDEAGSPWLLEVNAFPDLAQTGPELRGLVAGLMEAVVGVAVRPFVGLPEEGEGEGQMVKVLDLDLGRR